MKHLVIAGLVGLLGCVLPAGCTAPEPSAPASSAPAGPSARQLIDGGAVVLDVRSQQEWDAGHLPSAKLVPVDQVGERVDEIAALVGGDKTKPVVVYCRSGNRSAKAKATLERAGFTNVVNGGGYEDLR